MTSDEHTSDEQASDGQASDEHAVRQGTSRSRGVGRPGARRTSARRRVAAGASACAVSGLAVAGLGVGFAGPAVAATAHRVVTGTVETPGTTSFTVKSGAATITVDVTSTTKYLDHGVSAPTVANVTVGERVEVFGTETGADAVDASQVRVLPAQPRAKVRSRLDRGLARLHSGVADVRGTVARVPVSCSLSSCRGTVRLTERVVSHGRAEVLTLGTASYGIGRDATAVVLVHLDRSGILALGHARGHRLLTTAVIAGEGRSAASGRLILVG